MAAKFDGHVVDAATQAGAVNGSGADRIAADAHGQIVGGDRFGQAEDPGLGGTVSRASGKALGRACHRADGDDAAAMRLHPGDRGAQHIKGAVQRDAARPAPVFGRTFFDRALMHISDGMDHSIDLFESREIGRDGGMIGCVQRGGRGPLQRGQQIAVQV